MIMTKRIRPQITFIFLLLLHAGMAPQHLHSALALDSGVSGLFEAPENLGLVPEEPTDERSLSLPGSTGAALRSEHKTVPTYFERNDGQAPSIVEFLARGPGYHLFLTLTGAVFELFKRAEP